MVFITSSNQGTRLSNSTIGVCFLPSETYGSHSFSDVNAAHLLYQHNDGHVERYSHLLSLAYIIFIGYCVEML